MPRRRGKFGEYGKRGNSVLAQRRKREAENPGFRVCRRCDRLIPVADVVLLSGQTPRCRPCGTEYTRSKKKLGPPKTARAAIFRLNAELSLSGLKHCTSCGFDKPLGSFYRVGSQCRACKSRYVSAWLKRKCARIGRGASRAQVLRDLSIYRRVASFERGLTAAVRTVFRRLGAMECRHHGWQEMRGSKCLGCVQRKDVRRRARFDARFVETVTRKEVWLRCGGICYLCDKPVDIRLATVDHVRPLARSGDHSHGNTRIAHRLCNSVKRDLGPLVGMMAVAEREA